MHSPLRPVIDELMPVMQRGDLVAFHQVFRRLDPRGLDLSPADLTQAVEELAPVLAHRPRGIFAQLALMAGTWVEMGGSPLPLASNVTTCALLAMYCRVKFAEYWPVAGGGRPMPDPAEPPTMDELIGLFEDAAGALKIQRHAAADIACSWFDARHWMKMLTSALAHREYRAAAATDLPNVLDLGTKLVDLVAEAHFLVGVAQVLDDEPVVVLDHVTRRGFRLTMSGVGDNFQLHTLLADRLIGDPADGLLAGDRPTAAWVARASTGDPTSPLDDPTRRQFRMFDGTGAYIYPEGRPADIARVGEARVIVLHPPHGNFGWLHGRTYPLMVPTLTLDHVMSADEAAQWQARVAPARETDMMARTRHPGR